MKTILITGGSSGLGLRLCVDYLVGGHTVYATYLRHPNSLLYLKKRYSQLTPTFLDLSLPQIASPLPPQLDTLILFAGTLHSSLVLREQPETFEAIIQTNLSSNAMLCQQLHPLLEASQNPHLIIVSSLSALKGSVGQVAYSASKAALIGFAKSLAKEWAKDQIKVNVILPGFMTSRQTLTLEPHQISHLCEANILKRFGTLKEISSVIRCITDTHSISGQVFNLDSRLL